ncbi:MAG: ABC transporter substrate-binding protein [Egibacteraceae bacterium]
MSRRIAVCAHLLLLIVAYGSAGNVAAAQEPAGDLVVGIGVDTTNLEGDMATLGQGSPNANIYERLVRMGSDFSIEPWLATSWELVDEAAGTWRFELREGVTLHDGSELTAQDVAWTFDRIARAGGRNIKAREGGTKVIDDHTIEYTPSEPNVKIPQQLVHPIFGIMKAGSDPVAAPVGTGPFRFVEYIPDELLRVERFADYWDPDHAAKVASVTWRYLPDADARLLALRAGDVDIIQDAPRDQLRLIDDDPRLAVVASPVGAYEAISFNLDGPPGYQLTQDPVIRQAVAAGIDREEIVATIWQGNAEPGGTIVPPAMLGDAAGLVEGGPEHDPARARQLLEDDGWVAGADGVYERDGQRLELVLISGFPDAAVHRPIPEVIAQQLAEVGVAVEIREVNDYSETLSAGEGDLWLERGNQNDADPAFLPGFLYISDEAGNPVEYGRWFGPGPEFDELLLEARATADLDRTRELAAQGLHILIDQTLSVYPLAGLTNLWAVREGIGGFEPHPAFVHTDFSTVTKA